MVGRAVRTACPAGRGPAGMARPGVRKALEQAAERRRREAERKLVEEEAARQRAAEEVERKRAEEEAAARKQAEEDAVRLVLLRDPVERQVGEAHAQRVGELVSAHIIPRPDEQLEDIMLK